MKTSKKYSENDLLSRPILPNAPSVDRICAETQKEPPAPGPKLAQRVKTLHSIITELAARLPSLQNAIENRCLQEYTIQQNIATISGSQAASQDFDEQFNQLQHSYQSYETQLDEYHSKQLELQNLIATLDNSVEQEEKRVEEQKLRMEESDIAMESIRDAQNDRTRAIQDIKLEISQLQEQIKTTESYMFPVAAAYNKRIEDLEQTLIDKSKEYRELSKLVHQVQNALIEKQCEFERLTKDLEEIDEQLENSNEETLQAQYDNEQQINASLRSQLEICLTTKNELQNIVDNLRQQIRDIQFEHSKLELDMQQNKETIGRLQENLKTAENIINQHTTTVEALRKESQESNLQFNIVTQNCTTKLSELKQSNRIILDQLKDNIKTMTTTHDAEITELKDKQEEILRVLREATQMQEISIERIAKEKIELRRLMQEYQQNSGKIESNLKLFQEEHEHNSSHLKEEYLTLQREMARLDAEEQALMEKKAEALQKKQECAQLDCELAQQEIFRRQLHNLMQDLRGSIRVLCRIRPLMQHDQETEYKTLRFDPVQCQLTLNLKEKENTYNFDTILGPDSTQEDVFEEVNGIVQSAIDGYKVCLFSYGQTGSGKTHTMTGGSAEADQGIIPRSVALIFDRAHELRSHGWKFDIQVSCCQIYLEKIHDLLAPPDQQGQDLKIQNDQINKNITVPGLIMRVVEDSVSVAKALTLATKNRTVASTGMNATSSRSHFIFTLYINMSNEQTNEYREGVLNLCDLAGSERISSACTTGEQRLETQKINASLSALSTVFLQLSQKQAHVQFRNTKLTELLQYCLSSDGKTMMIVNLSPTASSAQETNGSLLLAQTVSLIQKGKTKQHTGKLPAASAEATPSIASTATTRPTALVRPSAARSNAAAAAAAAPPAGSKRQRTTINSTISQK